MASDDLDRFARVIRNLYTAMFEKNTKKHNRSFTYAFSPRTSGGYLVVPVFSGGLFAEMIKDHPIAITTSGNYGTTTTLPGYPLAGIDVVGTGLSVNTDNLISATRELYWDPITNAGWDDFTLEWSMNLTGASTQPNDTNKNAIKIALSGSYFVWVEYVIASDTWVARYRTPQLGTGTNVAVFSTDMRGNHLWAIVENNHAGEAYLYKDGVLVETETITPHVMSAATPELSPGLLYAYLASSTTAVTSGTAEIGIVVGYSIALPAHRILAHYNAWANITTSVAGIFTQPPTNRTYTKLTLTGSDLVARAGDSSGCVFTSTVSMGVPVAYGDETQMWGVFRFRVYWSSGSPATNPTVFRWRDDANNEIKLWLNGANWEISRKNAGAGSPATVAASHGQYDDITLAFAITATNVLISLDGAAFTSVGNTAIPTLAATSMAVGNGDGVLSGRMHWAILGTGTISDADVAELHAYGNADPAFDDIPNIDTLDPSLLWHCTFQSTYHGLTGHTELADQAYITHHVAVSTEGEETFV